MYVIGLIIYLAFLVGTTLLVGAPGAFIDLPSLMIILVFSISMLMASGLLPDLMRGFKLMGKKVNTYSSLELKKTEIAAGLMIKLLLLSGLLGSLIGSIAMLAGLSDISLLGKNLAVALLTLLYALLLVFILLPVRAKVRAVIQTLD
jgi:flagellar motor component MotA